MTRSTGTITGGNALSLMAAIHTAVDSHAAWEHVETVTNTPSTGDEWRVYKSLGASNGYGTDFYISFLYDASASTQQLYYALSEGYNAATNEFSNYAPGAAAVAINVAADATIGNAINDPNNMSTTTLQGYLFSPSLYVLTNATSFDYHISVTNHRVIVATSIVTVNNGAYLGLYEDFVQIPNNFPICLMSLGSSGDQGTQVIDRSQQGFCTRHPGKENGAASNYNFSLAGGSAPYAIWSGGVAGTPSTSANSAKDLFLGGAMGSRIMVKTGGVLGYLNSANGHVHGFLRGLLRDVLVLQSESTVVSGDTFTFGSTVYDVVFRRANSNDVCFLVPTGV